MYFTLEAMQAEDGDALILHYGDPARPRFFLIDGGPTKTGYEQVIRERLFALRKKWAPPGKPLTLDMMMVSHIDADHIAGVLCLTEELLEQRRDGSDRLCQVLTLWFNSFNETLGDGDSEIFTNLASEGAKCQAAIASADDAPLPSRFAGVDEYTAAIIASVPQGRKLRRNAEELRIKPNTPFEGLVMTGDDGPQAVEWGDDMTITVLCPERKRIERLHRDWEANLKKQPTLSALAELAAATKVTKDTAPANLSSIVAMVELKNKRILLTGDARDDDVLAGLKAAGYLKRGKCHLEILKMPHHGSHRNTTPEFLAKVTADHYVISGNGKHGNPSDKVLNWIVESREKTDAYTIHMTYKKGPEGLTQKVNKFLKAKKRGTKYRVEFAKEGGSLVIDLLDEIDY